MRIIIINEAIKDVISIGWGFYLSVIATVACAFFYFKKG